MNLIEESFRELFPKKVCTYDVKLKYSGRFSDYNANVKMAGNSLEFSFSKKWRFVSKEIQMGLIQVLLLKLFKPKGKSLNEYKTTNIDLYNMFMKNLHLSVAKDNVDPLLSERFDILNKEYFNGMLDKPNLIWGEKTFRKLGSYEFGNDTISISSILHDARQEIMQELVDFVLYHEMLHKKLKFKHAAQKSTYHTKEFKELEKKFPNSALLEKELQKLSSRKRFFEWF